MIIIKIVRISMYFVCYGVLSFSICSILRGKWYGDTGLYTAWETLLFSNLFICCDHHDHRNHTVSNTATD